MKNNQKSRTIILLKKKLRKDIQRKRDNIEAADRRNKSKKIVEKLYKTEYYIDSKNILAYYPFRSEIDTSILIEHSLKTGKNIILPKVYGNELKLYYIEKLPEQLKTGKYGILEPVSNLCEPAAIEDIDLAIIPGLGFDKNLNRLGYGGGFFDRLLPLIPEKVKKIALCFDIQVVESIPVLETDIKPDLLITESGIYHS